MDNTNYIVNEFEQSVPLWDEQEQTQSVQKFNYSIKTDSKVPKIGVMLVGLGGNNGSTFTAGILANKKKQ